MPPLSVVEDKRPLLLFDMNGVLCCKDRRSLLRQGLEHLATLLPTFRLGVYTSTTARNAVPVLFKIERAAFRGVPGFDLSARRPPRGCTDASCLQVFEAVLTREHCLSDVEWAARGGNAWDTFKPLAAHGLPLARCVLVDDTARKSLPSERANALVLPSWTGGSEPPVLRVLAQLLVAACGQLAPDADVRAALHCVRAGLVETSSL